MWGVLRDIVCDSFAAIIDGAVDHVTIFRIEESDGAFDVELNASTVVDAEYSWRVSVGQTLWVKTRQHSNVSIFQIYHMNLDRQHPIRCALNYELDEPVRRCKPNGSQPSGERSAHLLDVQNPFPSTNTTRISRRPVILEIIN
jgi:hypothetical protein